MEKILATLALAISTFVFTNLDDLVILSIYFAIPYVSVRQVVIGQFLGLAALVLLSLCGMWLGSFWDHRYISFLGLVPIFLGVKGLYALYRHFNESDPEPTFNTTATLNFMNVATVTFANGGDNLGVYTPIFAHIDTDGIIVFVSVFVLMTAFWCMLGFYLVQHVAIRSIFEKYGKVILPCFMIIIGIWILLT